MNSQTSKIKMGGPLGFAIIFLLSFLFTSFAPLLVLAQEESVEYIDKVTVRFRGEIFVDANPYDGTRKWQRGAASCTDTVDDSSGDDNDDPDVATVIYQHETDDGGCVEDSGGHLDSVPMTNTSRKDINGYRVTSDPDNQIFLPIGIAREATCFNRDLGDYLVNSGSLLTERGRYYKRLPPEDRPGEPANQYHLVKEDGGLNNKFTIETSDRNHGGMQVTFSCPGSGDTGDFFGGIITLSESAIPDDYDVTGDGPNSDPAGGGGGGAADDGGPTCEEANNNIAVTWLVCSLVQFMDDAVMELSDFVDELLIIDEDRYSAPELKEAWSYFRNIASFMLIIIGLVMVIGQAVSKE